MNSQKIEGLIGALREELQQYGEMLALLDQQQEQLVRRASQDILDALATIDEQRERILQARQAREDCQQDLRAALDLPVEATLSEMTARLPEKYQALVKALVQENNRLLLRVRQRAQQNHILLSYSLELMQRFIASLLPLSRAKLYTEAGNLCASEAPMSSLYEAIG